MICSIKNIIYCKIHMCLIIVWQLSYDIFLLFFLQSFWCKEKYVSLVCGSNMSLSSFSDAVTSPGLFWHTFIWPRAKWNHRKLCYWNHKHAKLFHLQSCVIIEIGQILVISMSAQMVISNPQVSYCPSYFKRIFDTLNSVEDTRFPLCGIACVQLQVDQTHKLME